MRVTRAILAFVVALVVVVAPTPGAVAATSVSCPATPAPLTTEQADRIWRLAADRLGARVGPSTYPFGATGSSRYIRTNAYAWTSGFFPTSLWLMYQRTSDPVWLERARAYTDPLLPVARWRGTHDLGFMVGGPAALGISLDPDSSRGLAYASAMQEAARSLSARWNGKVGAMRSAYYGGRWGLIIDSAMNAPLLMEVGLLYGGADGRALGRRGTQHMLTLAREFVRADGSTFHRLAFNPRTGQRTGVLYGQGLSSTSTWARGQAWAVNGFARAHLMTGDARLLDAARRTADYWISRVPAGCVPAWDLDVTRASAPRDSSAAAILADGLLVLALTDPDDQRAAAYRAYALTALGTLASPAWVPDRGRGVLVGQSYNVPADAREGTYAWGDAYLLHALAVASATADLPPTP